MALENHYSVYYITSIFSLLFFCRTRRQSQAYKCLVWLHVGLCVWLWRRGYWRIWQKKKEKTPARRARRLRRGGVGWHNEWHIVKSLPTKQSLLPCKWDLPDKDLFDGTHAEYEAVNSLISIPQSWLAKTRESQPESMSAKTQYWFV